MNSARNRYISQDSWSPTFSRATNVSDIRSWFGLVNQVSNYAKLSDLMAPLKPFLSPKVKFQWDYTMEEAFVGSK